MHILCMCCTSCVTMAPRKEQTKEQITAVTSLSLGGRENKETAAIMGLELCSVQWWTKQNRDAGGTDLPLQKKRPGRPHVTYVRILKVIKHQVDVESRISTKELKEKVSRVLHSTEISPE